MVVGLAAVAPMVVAVLLGPQWHEVGPLISLLAFHGLVDVFLRTAAAAVLASGRPVVYVKIYALQVCVLLPLSFWLTREYGVQGAVVATVGTALALLPLNATLVARALGVTARQLLAAVWRPLVAAAIMYGVTVLAQPSADAATLTAGHGLTLLGDLRAVGGCDLCRRRIGDLDALRPPIRCGSHSARPGGRLLAANDGARGGVVRAAHGTKLGAPPSSFVSRTLEGRDYTVDAVRGLAIAGMVLVNGAPPTDALYPPLVHAPWHGWTLADTIFPLFLFIVGISITFSLRPADAGQDGGRTGRFCAAPSS